jgi:hypothetical protein
MSANITAVLSEREAALSIPAEAVFVEGNQSLVYAVQADSTVQRVAVALGTRTATDVEVVDGLTAGQRIVVAGHQKLFPGAKVMPVESTAPSNAGPGGAAQGGPGGAASPGSNGADAKGGDGK